MECLNNMAKAIGEAGQEMEKGFVFWGVIADILEKYDINTRAKIYEFCNWFQLDNQIRHYLYDRCIKEKPIYCCPKCKGQVSFKNVSDGYFAQCRNCDEDFYLFELEE